MALTSTPSANLGAAAPDFDLPGADGKRYRLADLRGQLVVVVFTCNHCPYAQALWPRLIRLAGEYQGRSVSFVAINPNDDRSYPEDSFAIMQRKVGEWGINFPYLRDESQSVAKAYGAVCTPDIFVYDGQRKLAYRGRFDDNWQDAAKVTGQDLRSALNAMLNDQPIPQPQHPSMGCSIKWK